MILGTPRLSPMRKSSPGNVLQQKPILGIFTIGVALWVTMLPSFAFPKEPSSCAFNTSWKETLKNADSPQGKLDVLQKAASACPKNLKIIEKLGVLQLEQNHPKASLSTFQTGLNRVPEFVNLLLGLAEAEITLNNYQEALRIYKVTANIQPNHPKIKVFLTDFRKFLPLANRGEDIEDSLLKIFFDGRRAKSQLNKSIVNKEIGSAHSNYLLAQAKALVKIGNTEEAEKTIQGAIESDPNSRNARKAMVEHILEEGDYFFRGEYFEEALKRYQNAFKWLKDSIPTHIRIARTLRMMPGKRKESLVIYVKAKQLLESADYLIPKGERAEYELAITEGLIHVDRKNPVYRKRAAIKELAKAERATKLGQLSKTIEAYHQALSWTPKDGRIHASLADTLRYVQSDWKKAIQHYALAIHHLKKNPPDGTSPMTVKSRIRHAEREQARLEKSHSGTLTYIRTRLFLAVQNRTLEAVLFVVVFGSVLIFLWRSKTPDENASSAEKSER